MTDLRITPGPWTISGSIYDPNLVHAAIWADGESQYPTVASVMTGPHAAANAEFIAEAGTVAHETGLTPRELLAQRDALVEALRDLLGAETSCYAGPEAAKLRTEARACARAALAKIRGEK